MDDNNKNMEEFFRNSMDQFSDEPSTKVWEGVGRGLDAAMPWYRRWFSWKKIGLGLLLLALLIGQGLFIENYLELKGDKVLLLETNEVLKSDLETVKLNCENQQNGLSERLVFLENEMKREVEKTATILEKQNVQNSYISQLIEEKKAVETKLLSANISLKNATELTKSISDFKKTSQIELPGLFYGKKDAQITDSEFIKVDTKRDVVNETILDLDNKSPLIYLKKATVTKVKRKNQSALANQKLPSGTVHPLRMNWTAPIYVQKPFRYGVESGFSAAFTDQKTIPQLSTSVGLRAEYFPWQKIGFTTALRFTNQAYKLEDIRTHVALNFPTISPTDNLEEVETNSNYLDLPIGVKFLRNRNGDNTSFYINPAFAAQLYFPQKYEYKFANGDQYSVRPNRHFLYIGNVHLGIGLEKKLSSKMTFQYGLWAEKSLQHIGLEHRHINVFGIQTAILFN